MLDHDSAAGEGWVQATRDGDAARLHWDHWSHPRRFLLAEPWRYGVTTLSDILAAAQIGETQVRTVVAHLVLEHVLAQAARVARCQGLEDAAFQVL